MHRQGRPWLSSIAWTTDDDGEADAGTGPFGVDVVVDEAGDESLDGHRTVDLADASFGESAGRGEAEDSHAASWSRVISASSRTSATSWGLADGVNRKIGPDSGHEIHLLVMDEIADFTMPQGTGREAKQAADQFNALLFSLVRKARAAGIILVAATQKPEGRVIPTYVRDQFTTRVALRCGNPQASDTILGSGKAQEGYSAAAPWAKGTALLYQVPADPFKIRAFHVPDPDLATLIARSAEATTEPRCEQ